MNGKAKLSWSNEIVGKYIIDLLFHRKWQDKAGMMCNEIVGKYIMDLLFQCNEIAGKYIFDLPFHRKLLCNLMRLRANTLLICCVTESDDTTVLWSIEYLTAPVHIMLGS